MRLRAELSRVSAPLPQDSDAAARLAELEAENERLRDRQPTPEMGEESSDVAAALEQLKGEHYELLVLLTNQELEKMRFLEILEEIGGPDAVARAQMESAALLVHAFGTASK